MIKNQPHLTLELRSEFQQPEKNCKNSFYRLPASTSQSKTMHAHHSSSFLQMLTSALDYLFLSSSTGMWLVKLLSLSILFLDFSHLKYVIVVFMVGGIIAAFGVGWIKCMIWVYQIDIHLKAFLFQIGGKD